MQMQSGIGSMIVRMRKKRDYSASPESPRPAGRGKVRCRVIGPLGPGPAT